jgi:hypothetical protein
VPGGIRTPNLLIRSQKLYPVELQALISKNLKTPSSKPQRQSYLEPRILNVQSWVADGTRTRNNQNHNLGLYH